MIENVVVMLLLCFECFFEYIYEMLLFIVCLECVYEFEVIVVGVDIDFVEFQVIVDFVGNMFVDGDIVIVIKIFKVKSVQQLLKFGIKVCGICLNFDVGMGQEDYNIDCKIDGFGVMMLKLVVVKKVQRGLFESDIVIDINGKVGSVMVLLVVRNFDDVIKEVFVVCVQENGCLMEVEVCVIFIDVV